MPDTNSNQPPKYISLIGLRYEEIQVLLRALDALAGEADDVETLTHIDALQKKIRGSVDTKGKVYGM